MSDFKREIRYTVLKHSDVGEALDADECTALIELEEKVALYRERAGKPPLECVVIESKHPEYESVWEMVKNRIMGIIDTKNNEQFVNVGEDEEGRSIGNCTFCNSNGVSISEHKLKCN
jgi:hypothetical protein